MRTYEIWQSGGLDSQGGLQGQTGLKGFVINNDRFGGHFFQSVFSPKGLPKNPQKMICLAGKILVSLPPIFCLVSDPANAHIRHNPKNDQELILKTISYIYIYIYIYFLLILRISGLDSQGGLLVEVKRLSGIAALHFSGP